MSNKVFAREPICFGAPQTGKNNPISFKLPFIHRAGNTLRADRSVLNILLVPDDSADIQKAIDNIADAIEKGVASDTLMNRLTDLEKQKKNLDRQIADEEKGIFRLDRDQVIYWLSQFKDGDIEDESFKRQLIDLMVNSVTVWELPDDDFEITTAYNLTSCKSKTFKASERFGFEKSCSTRKGLLSR